MRYRKTENTMSLLGGALLGAAAMYLLDPDMGRKRREWVKDQASDYAGTAGDALQSGWEHVRETAKDVGQTVAARAGDYGDKLSDMAHDYSDRIADRAKDAGSSWSDRARDMASDMSSSLGDTFGGWRKRGRKMLNRYSDKAHDYADDYSDRASDVSDNVTDYGNRLWNQVRGLGSKLSSRARDAADDARDAAGEGSSPVLPVTVTAVGCCAIGVGLMYLMDPRLGRSRRAWLTDKATSLFRQTGRSFYRTGRDIANRTQGYAYETASHFSGGPVSSEQLRDRIRSEMGRTMSEPRLIQVMTDNNGLVTLTGSCKQDEVDGLVTLVEAIPGVRLVINRLETRGAENPSGNQGQSVPQM